MNALLSERSIKMWLFYSWAMWKENGNKLLHSGLALQAHILNLGHHGSRTSSSLAFLETVAPPQAAIYSAGRRNVYGHPHQEVLDRLKILGIPAFGTRRHGTITVITDGTDFEIISSVGSDRELAKSLQ